MTTWVTSFYGRGPNNRENGLRPKRRRPGSLPDTRVKEAGDQHPCRDLEHQCDTHRPPQLDRNRFANPPELFTDTPRFARAQILTNLRRNPNRSSLLHLHAGEFHLSKERASSIFFEISSVLREPRVTTHKPLITTQTLGGPPLNSTRSDDARLWKPVPLGDKTDEALLKKPNHPPET
ncbi:unnamed protein product [Brassica napus]|uniref:(rape) hypothetical protein n=1 Tax=Brassica napus TaxID=3708 RepID=A0A816XAY1_BRANA|nr:unnamed protein product [Brassica napus]